MLSMWTFVGILLLATAVVEAGEHEALDIVKKTFPDWKPDAIIDVGANQGTWTRAVHEKFPKSKFLMVEAAEFQEPGLQKVAKSLKNVEVVIAVTSQQDGEDVEWFEVSTSGGTGNSMFREKGGVFADVKPKIRKSKTLDTIKQESFLSTERVDILKLDVQGAELVVLEGAKKILEEVTFVQFEASITVYNKGQPCLYEIDNFLRSQGLFLYDQGNINRNLNGFDSGGIGQMDLLYVRPSSDRLPNEMRQRQPNFCGADRGGGPFLDNTAIHTSAAVTPVVYAPPDPVVPQSHTGASILFGFVCGYIFANAVRRSKKNTTRSF